MTEHTDVTIISAFGRGHWMASELREAGRTVNLVDVSSSMGHWSPADWEGPFGLFQSESISSSQKLRLLEEDDQDSVTNGFTLWLKNGPMELKGPLARFSLEQNGTDIHNLAFLESNEESIENHQALKKMPFQANWLSRLAYQMGSTVYHCNDQAFQSPGYLPLAAPHFVRRVSRKGLEKSLAWLKSKDVGVVTRAKVNDISVANKKISSIEVESEVGWSGALGMDQLVWCITSEETSVLKNRILKFLYPKGALPSYWCWVRYGMQLADGPYLESVPIKFTLISDVALPWTHENMCMIQRTEVDREWDVWVRIPVQHRFQRSYVGHLGEKITALLLDRIPKCDAKIVQMPQDYIYEYKELGPPRFPVFKPQQRNKWSALKLKNLYFDGPEYWDTLDWTGQFKYQSTVFNTLLRKF